MTEHQHHPRAEGAPQTEIIVEAVRRARHARRWSAAQLADEMQAAGVPWNQSVVENLEHSRRKSLRVHEWLALSWVLGVQSPLDLLVPDDPAGPMYPVTPRTAQPRESVLAWCRGETAPPRQGNARRPGSTTGGLLAVAAAIRDLAAAVEAVANGAGQ
jgi:hypothetical protein